MGKKYTREQIFEKLKTILVDDFELAPEKVVLEANLFEDLELDSIDAVDLAVKLQEFTEKKFADILFSLILVSMIRQDYDPSSVLMLVKKTLY